MEEKMLVDKTSHEKTLPQRSLLYRPPADQKGESWSKNKFFTPKTIARLRGMVSSRKEVPISTSVTTSKPPDLCFLGVFSNTSRYEICDQVGEGTYGMVFKGWDHQTKEPVALKKVLLKDSNDSNSRNKNRDGFPMTSIREIQLLQKLRGHPNIVCLRAMIAAGYSQFGNLADGGKDAQDGPLDKDEGGAFTDPAMYMVFEYMDHDLTGIFQHANITFDTQHIKCLAAQMFTGLQYLHENLIMHRDIKSANILVNSKGQLKIADFGLARCLATSRYNLHIDQDFNYTNRVVTLWYRAPELLLGEQQYSFGIDVWAAACIFLEFYTKVPIFRGNNEIEQAESLWKVCGSPLPDSWPEAFSLPWFDLLKPKEHPRKFESNFKRFNLTPEGMNLADMCLTLNPNDRPTALQVLQHPFFTTETPLACKPWEIPNLQGHWHEFEGKLKKRGNQPPEKPSAPASMSTSMATSIEPFGSLSSSANLIALSRTAPKNTLPHDVLTQTTMTLMKMPDDDYRMDYRGQGSYGGRPQPPRDSDRIQPYISDKRPAIDAKRESYTAGGAQKDRNDYRDRDFHSQPPVSDGGRLDRDVTPSQSQNLQRPSTLNKPDKPDIPKVEPPTSHNDMIPATGYRKRETLLSPSQEMGSSYRSYRSTSRAESQKNLETVTPIATGWSVQNLSATQAPVKPYIPPVASLPPMRKSKRVYEEDEVTSYESAALVSAEKGSSVSKRALKHRKDVSKDSSPAKISRHPSSEIKKEDDYSESQDLDVDLVKVKAEKTEKDVDKSEDVVAPSPQTLPLSSSSSPKKATKVSHISKIGKKGKASSYTGPHRQEDEMTAVAPSDIASVNSSRALKITKAMGHRMKPPPSD